MPDSIRFEDKKCAVFFHDYKLFHEIKDPGQIPIGLNEIGIDVSFVTLKKKELLNYI